MKLLLAIMILPLTACESNKDSEFPNYEFPKLTESEKQAFQFLNQ